jgi:hypothetical protein
MRRFVAAVTIGIYLLTTIPYLFGYAMAGPEEHFTGIVFDVADTAQYFAWMRSFSHNIIIANPLTPEPGAERFFNLQWWLLGLFAFKTPLGPVIVYQLLRVIALAGFSTVVAGFCHLVSPQRAKLGFAMVMLTSGFGWVLVALKHILSEDEVRYPLDIHVGEANSFFAAMAFPHLLVAGALLIAVFILFLNATGSRKWRYSLALIPLTLCLGFSHGYDLIPAMAIPAATALILSLRERRVSDFVWPATAIVIGAAPPALYALALTRLDGTWKGVLSQYGNAGVFSPSPPHLLILLGLPLVLALPQLKPTHWRTADVNGLFVRVWAVVGFFLLYIPTDYQIKMLIAYQVPVSLMAAATLNQAAGTLARHVGTIELAKVRLAGATLVLGFIALTNIYLTGWRMVDLRRTDYPYYLADADIRAIQELDDVAREHDIVLSSETVGVFVPVYSDSRPYLAHWAQTLDYLDRREQVAWFFQPTTSDESRAAFLSEHGIDFVISGPAEAAQSQSSSPVALHLEPVVSGTTTLYRSTNERAWKR